MNNKTDKKPYQEDAGVWHVTTEGDCEGRTVRDLGVHEGTISQIAQRIGGEAEYKLRFSPPKSPTIFKPSSGEVHISLDIDSGTWDMDPKKRIAFFRRLIKDPSVTIEDSNYYASVKLVFKKTLVSGYYWMRPINSQMNIPMIWIPVHLIRENDGKIVIFPSDEGEPLNKKDWEIGEMLTPPQEE